MKTMKKSLAVILAVLMVLFSFPLSALAYNNPANAGYEAGQEPYSTDYDVHWHMTAVAYTSYGRFWNMGTNAKPNAVRYDIHDMKWATLNADFEADTTGNTISEYYDIAPFALVISLSGVDSLYSYSVTLDYDPAYIVPVYFSDDLYAYTPHGEGGTDANATLAPTMLADRTNYETDKDRITDGGSSSYLLAGGNDGWTLNVNGGDLDQNPTNETTTVKAGRNTLDTVDGSILGVFGFILLQDCDLADVFTPQVNVYRSAVRTDSLNTIEKDIVFPNSVDNQGHPNTYTTFGFEDIGIGDPNASEPEEVTYTYTFADGGSTQVTAAAGTEPIAPPNTAAKTASNNDGTHTVTTYSWPAWEEGKTSYTEVATDGDPAACTMEDVPGTAVAPTHTTAGKEADQKCSVCGYTVTGAEIPANTEDHKWTPTGESQASTCSTQGWDEYECVCGETMRRPRELDPSNHEALEEIAAIEATCVVEGFTAGEHCTACGVTTVEPTSLGLDPENHKNIVTDAAVPATCTSTGLTEGSHCADCSTDIVAQVETEMIAHDWQITSSTGATCQTPGTVNYECSMCHNTKQETGELDPNTHVGDIVSADNGVAPTRGEDGKEADMIYEGCGHIAQEGAVIPALGVQITVEGSELGTVTLNGEAVTYGVANKVAYEENYTLAATPSEDAEFVGWSVGGKIISTDATYTTAAYADLTYVPVFAQKTNDFTVTFVDRFNMVLGTVSGADVAALEAMPEIYDYLGYTFTGWSMSLEEVQALSENTVVTANYEKDDSITYTVSAPGCVITVDGAEYNDTAEVGFDQGVTVKAADGTATAWTVNGANAAYGAEYTFYVTSDVTVAYTSDEVTAVPTVAAVDVTPTENGRVRFLASRSVPEGYTVVESGFVYGKDYEDAEAALVLENATTGGCYLAKSSNTANDGQFALTFGIASGTGVAYARAYVIAVDAEGNSAVYYADVQSFDYDA